MYLPSDKRGEKKRRVRKVGRKKEGNKEELVNCLLLALIQVLNGGGGGSGSGDERGARSV